MSNKPKLTDTQAAALVRRWQTGASLRALAAEFGVSPESARKALLRAGLRRTHEEAKFRRRKGREAGYLHPRDTFSRAEWEAMYWDPAEFPSIEALALRLGFNNLTVASALHYHRIPIRDQGTQLRLEGVYGRARARWVNVARARQLAETWRESDEPARVLAARDGVSAATVRRRRARG